jgi:sugar phosphate isomerase/epimerase
MSLDQAIQKIKDAGYQGVEMAYISGVHNPVEIRNLVDQYDLKLIVAQVFAHGSNFESYSRDFDRYLTEIADLNPLYIISHTGRDYYSFEQNSKLVEQAQALGEKLSVEIIHETHRGRFLFHGPTSLPYLEKYPNLKLNADFSHWCVVSESLLENQEDCLDLAIARTEHIHARVGYDQGPQVNDPRAPEWKETFERHLSWWDRIIEHHKNVNRQYFNITPEFGPAPYLPSAPYTQEPLANQWELNLFMKDFLDKRYNQI